MIFDTIHPICFSSGYSCLHVGRCDTLNPFLFTSILDYSKSCPFWDKKSARMTSELDGTFRELGLSQYLDAFVDQGFDTWDTILDIQESDLCV